METIKKIPKPLLVVGVIIIAALIVMISDPPKGICDAQLELFYKAQEGRLFSLREKVESLWSRTAKYCQKTKTLGGCVEFLSNSKLLVRDINNSPIECVPRLLDEDGIFKALRDTLSIMVKLGWGEEAPELGPSVYGWMTPSEFSLFCDIKTLVLKKWNDEEWEMFERQILYNLPHYSEHNFTENFERSLFSLRCEIN